MEDAADIIMPIAGMLLAALIIHMAFRRKRDQEEGQRSVQLALLNKFATAEEMTRFLETSEGQRLIDQLAVPSDNDPRRRAIGMIAASCVMGVIAMGLLVLVSVDVGDRGHFFIIPSVMTGAIAVGLAVGAAVSYFASKKLGLIRDR